MAPPKKQGSQPVPVRRWIDGQQLLLEMIARGAPLGDVLDRLALEIEAQIDDAVCSILMVDEQGRLWSAGGPNIPPVFSERIDGLQIGPQNGSCGSAAYTKALVIASDIASDPRWTEWRELALGFGFRSCWSTPVLGATDNILGTFALYHPHIGEPSDAHIRIAADAAHIAAIAIDRSRVESLVHASETRLREIAESIDEMFYVDVVDKGGPSDRADYVSPAFERIWGRSREEVARDPKAWLTSVHADDIERVRAAIAARLHGASYDIEYRIVRPDGVLRWIHDRNVAVRDGSGRITRFVGVVNDITERKCAELVLAESEARLARIIGSAMDAIIAVDESHRIVVFNSAAEEVFRTSAADAMGQTLDTFLPEASRANHPEQMNEFSRTGLTIRTATHPANVCGRRADGEEFPLEATISRTDVAGRVLLTVILRDITQRKHLESQLRQSQKMEAMGQLAGGIAHDFNNLLTAIRASAELLLEELPSGQLRADAEEIRLASDRAAALTRQLLAFSRKQVLRPGIIDLNVVVGSIETLLRRVISQQVTLSVVTSDDPAWVLADAGQLEQILVNLAVNARDAMPHGGTISIATAVVSGTALPSSVPPRPELQALGHAVLLSVHDNGTGMDDAVRARAFEPFFTTKELGLGSGLGLATVNGIVDQSGGSVAIESTPHVGTTVYIALPFTAPLFEQAVPTLAATPTRHGSGTVLVVEDEPGVRSVVRRVLTHAGYTLFEAGNAREAVVIWREQGGHGYDHAGAQWTQARGTAARRARGATGAVHVGLFRGWRDRKRDGTQHGIHREAIHDGATARAGGAFAGAEVGNSGEPRTGADTAPVRGGIPVTPAA